MDMLRNEKNTVRVWNDGEMLFPTVYSFIKKVGKPLKLRYVTNRVPIETTKFMLPVLYDGMLMYEQDIVNCKEADTKKEINGVLKYIDELCCYAVFCAGKCCPLMNLFEISILGNTFENPDLLKDLLRKSATICEKKPANKKSTEPPKVENSVQTKPAKPTETSCHGIDEIGELDKQNVVVYTDGSCIGNPGPGGAAYIIRAGSYYHQDSYPLPNETTNNICEITAAIRALKFLPEGCKVTLHSDSQYVINAFNKRWLDTWMKNSWIKSDGKEVKNIPLWKDLLEAAQPHEVNWVWVKGHVGNPDNELCDKLAVEASAKAAKN